MLYLGLLINKTTFQYKHIFSIWVLNISKTEGNGLLRDTLNMEAGCSSKMLVPVCETACHPIPEYGNLGTCCHQNLRSHSSITFSLCKGQLGAHLFIVTSCMYYPDPLQWHVLHSPSTGTSICWSEWEEFGNTGQWEGRGRTKVWRCCTHTAVAGIWTGNHATTLGGWYHLLFVQDKCICLACWYILFKYCTTAYSWNTILS